MKKVRVKNAFGCITHNPKTSHCMAEAILVLVKVEVGGVVEIKDRGLFDPYLVMPKEPFNAGDYALLYPSISFGIRPNFHPTEIKIEEAHHADKLKSMHKYVYKIVARPDDFNKDHMKKISKGEWKDGDHFYVDCKPKIKYRSVPHNSGLDKHPAQVLPRVIGYSVKFPIKMQLVPEIPSFDEVLKNVKMEFSGGDKMGWFCLNAHQNPSNPHSFRFTIPELLGELDHEDKKIKMVPLEIPEKFKKLWQEMGKHQNPFIIPSQYRHMWNPVWRSVKLFDDKMPQPSRTIDWVQPGLKEWLSAFKSPNNPFFDVPKGSFGFNIHQSYPFSRRFAVVSSFIEGMVAGDLPKEKTTYLKPKYFHDKMRLNDIKKVIMSSVDNGEEIPVGWIEEYNDLVKRVDK